MNRILILFLATFVFFHSRAQTISTVWVADNGNGTYKNPIIHADYSDPDAIRVGDDYYMISSSFNHVPGLPILHSKDLVNWKLIGYALKKLPSPYFDIVRHGGGVWAPSIRFHNGEFYIYFPDPDFGIFLTKAKNITGPWTEPVLVEAGKGLIDPCPLWDDDVLPNSNSTESFLRDSSKQEKVYLVHAYAGSRSGFKSIIVVKELNINGTKVVGDPVMVYDGHDLDATIEGPKFYKRNGYYYIFAPAGGVSTGWQTILRSKNVYGPYERKVVMNQGSTSINGPHQGAWVTTQTNEDWFLHFQDKDAYGRVVHLQPMKWINDWPLIGEDKERNARTNISPTNTFLRSSSGRGKGEPVIVYKKPNVGKIYSKNTVADTDEFNEPKLGLQWQWQANPKEGWAFATPSGSLRMFSVYQPDSILNLWNTPNILGQKLPAEEFTATVKVNFNPKFVDEEFGLIMFGLDYAFISIVKGKEGLYVNYQEGLNVEKSFTKISGKHFPVKGNKSYLQIKMKKEGICQFSFSEDGEIFIVIDKSFVAKPGKWVGAKLGMFCLRNTITNDAGYADIDWIHIEKNKL